MKIAREIKEQSKVTSLDDFLASQEKSTNQNLIEPSSSVAHFQNIHRTRQISNPKLNISQSQNSIYKSDDEELRLEINRLQTALVEKFKGPQKQVSGSQFRTTVRERVHCDSCDNKEFLLKRAKESIRLLKHQLSQCDIEGKPLPSQRTNVFEQSLTIDETRIDDMTLRNSELENIVKHQAQTIAKLQQDLFDMCEHQAIKSKQSQQEYEALQNTCTDIRKKYNDREEKCLNLANQLDMKCGYVSLLEEQLQTLQNQQLSNLK